MNTEVTVFFILATLLVASSFLVIFQRNPVHSALALVATLFIMAILFLVLEAPMVAALQIFVYAGAIMVVFLFVIMLLDPGMLERRRLLWWGLGSLAAALLALELMVLFLPLQGKKELFTGSRISEDFGSPKEFAESLFTDFVLPFEVASVLLLVALIGAVVLGKRES
ncbi:MAG: NADH-quinone oxidoreductase subunit J [Candidatus Binatia bacterium]